MAALMWTRSLVRLKRYTLNSNVCQVIRKYSDEGRKPTPSNPPSTEIESATANSSDASAETRDPASGQTAGEKALSGFARAMQKAQQEHQITESIDATPQEELPDESFASLFRKSKLVQLGDLEHRIVLGTITDVVGDDLYIDFGGKFNAVCPLPKLQPERYHRGAKVKLRLHDFEMTSKFLGSEKHITLLEAEATLIGLRRKTDTA